MREHEVVVVVRTGDELLVLERSPVLHEEHVAYRWCIEHDAVELLAYEEPRDAVRAAVTA